MTAETGPAVMRVGDVALTWGESLRWDDRRQRLYLVDCATASLHWLEGGGGDVATLRLPGMPTGVVLTHGDELVVCLDDGLHVVDPDRGRSELLAAYPPGMHGRANDANADGAGNLVTGTLNLGPGPGALFQYSSERGWRLLGTDAGNVNGPAVLDLDGERTLVCADTVAGVVHASPYDPDDAAVGPRSVLHDHASVGGLPDGATVDAEGRVWSCVLRRGALVRLGEHGAERLVELPVANPSDVAFGGPDMRRLFVTSIAVDLGAPPGPEGGRLLALDVGIAGRPEPRFSLG